jgi:hypothetical protein
VDFSAASVTSIIDRKSDMVAVIEGIERPAFGVVAISANKLDVKGGVDSLLSVDADGLAKPDATFCPQASAVLIATRSCRFVPAPEADTAVVNGCVIEAAARNGEVSEPGDVVEEKGVLAEGEEIVGAAATACFFGTFGGCSYTT